MRLSAGVLALSAPLVAGCGAAGGGGGSGDRATATAAVVRAASGRSAPSRCAAP